VSINIIDFRVDGDPCAENVLVISWELKMELYYCSVYMAPLCLMWCLWKERNAHSFKDCETGLINLKKLVIQTLFMWRVKIQSMSGCSYSNFLDMCSLFSLN
jgi:hypothetical protein